MAKQTLHDRYCAALTARGWERVINARTSKYTVFERREDGPRIFVGRAGAIRVGRTASSSYPMSEKLKAALREGTS